MKTIAVVVITALALSAIASAKAQTAVLFGASGAVGSEVLASLLLLDESFFHEVILIGRRSSPKIEQEILSVERIGDATNVTSVTLPDLSDITSYDGIERADACFVAVGVGDINEVTLQHWHSVEVELVGSIAQFCDRVHAKSITVLSAVDVDHEAVTPFTPDELDTGKQVLGWMKAIYHYYRVKGLEDKAVVTNAERIPHIRLFQPSTIVTKEVRYPWIERILRPLHALLDPLLGKYHSVDVRLLGMAMVADAREVLQSPDTPRKQSIAQLTYEDYERLAGKAFAERYGGEGGEL